MFQSLGARFDSFGELQAAAALAGALGGIVLGRFIDLGHARSATRLNAVVLTGILLLKAACGSDAIVVATVAIATYMIGGIYIPSIMTAFYNEAKRSPDPLRFQIFAEGGWDVGAGIVGLVATALCISGAPYQVIILLSLPAVFIQMRVLERSYVVLQNAREGREPRVAASATSPVDCGPLG